MILLIDNYDSFTFNLNRYLRQLGQSVSVLRNDAEELRDDLTRFDAIVISPGPKTPDEAGLSLELVRRYSGQIPILGVCLGHQVICEAFGGKTIRAEHPMHGQSSAMTLEPSRLFEGIESGTHFARYHSLVTCPQNLPQWLRVTAVSSTESDSSAQEIMAVEHIEHPTFGVQFHPESILSSSGHQLIQNFLACTGLQSRAVLPSVDLVHTDQLHAPNDPVEPDDLHDAYPLPMTFSVPK